MKVVINECFGGFGLSDTAYEKLHEWGIPIRKWIPQERDETTGLYKEQPLNDGEVIFDRSLDEDSKMKDAMLHLSGRYWECFLDPSRTHPLLIRAVEELGDKVNASTAKLKIIEIPDGTDYEIQDYDGNEHIAEKHQTWR